MRVSGVTLGAVLASALAGVGVGLWPVAQKRLPEPTQVTLGGSVPAPGVALSTWLGRRAEVEGAREVLVHHPEGVLVVPRDALGLTLDTDQARTELARPRVPSSLFTRLRVALGGAPPAPVDIEPRYRLDATRAAA